MLSDYEQKLKSQIEQYQTGEEIHDLPPIYHYWSNKYVAPKMQELFYTFSVSEFYALPFLEVLKTTPGKQYFVSVGSGDSSTEIEVCKFLVSSGFRNFEFHSLEVNDALLAEATKKVSDQGLADLLLPRRFDVNVDTFDFPLAGVMAHHSLHHIVELERLFDTIDDKLIPNGRFLTMDMIGRNGHMRWPEALGFLEALWNMLPPERKFNHQLKECHLEFINFDCSKEGFEGIRAQDILPLLVSRFSFNAFMAFGGIVEVLIDRGYGPNFSEKDPLDLKLVDFVQSLNEQLIDIGLLKPTMLFADMTKKNPAVRPRVDGIRTPQFCIRDPDHAPDILARGSSRASNNAALSIRIMASKEGGKA